MKKLVNESLNENKGKFTFKKYRPIGRYRSFEPQDNYDIKLNGKMVGNIKEDERKFTIGFKVNKKDPMEDKNPNCSWKFVRLKRKFDSAEEAIEFIKINTEKIQIQFDLYCPDEI